MKVLKTLYSLLSFGLGSFFFISYLFSKFLLFTALSKQRECVSVVPELAWIRFWFTMRISVFMNLNLNSSKKPFQCLR